MTRRNGKLPGVFDVDGVGAGTGPPGRSGWWDVSRRVRKNVSPNGVRNARLLTLPG